MNFDAEAKLNDCLKSAVDIGYLPISLDNPEKEPKTLKTDNRELYGLVKDFAIFFCCWPSIEPSNISF